MRFLRFLPIYKERVWGGDDFDRHLGRAVPAHSNPYGESWEISDRDDAQSVVAGGAFAGATLRSLIAQETGWLMGRGWPPAARFPLLVKWLSCRERLSLQVHPPEELARELGGDAKNELWYIAAAEPHAALIAGFKRGATREKFAALLERNDLEPILHRFPVAAGDALYTPSGRVHAIDAGCFILEVQQNSDTTYRVYDWGRPRELHVEQSLRCANFNDHEPAPLRHSEGELLITDSAGFRTRAFALAAGDALPPHAAETPAVVGVVAGELAERADGSVLRAGDNVILPAAERFDFVATRPTRVLLTDEFAAAAGAV
ncbi:MAG: class I mannose-6-phosphate isomerase [Puniceicoccales bacterium]|jgi:mannose-6-phosphate isomerase|nr:class I mannose-6-phosphate isomerase [Puniceicoccales bacterium]